ncbi:MAG: hypothetical protein ACLFXM_04600 [Acidimicrobiia bacterium]
MAAAPVYSTRFKLVAALVLTVAIAAFVTAYLATQQGDDDPVVSSGAASEAVENLIPDRGDQVPQQQTVGVDLAGGWNAALAVNGVEIPDGELDVTPELSLVQFTPADGRTVEQFQPGRNCVEATIWPLSEGRGGEETRTVGWCFDVV